MKILIVTDAWKPQLNGVVRTYEFLTRELENLGHSVRIIGPCEFPVRFALPGYREIELAVFPYRRLCRLIDSFVPDSIHIGTEGPLGRAAMKYCRRRGIKFTTAYHTHFPDYAAKRAAKFLPFLYKPVHRAATAWLRNFHNRGNGIITATQSLEDGLRAQGFTAPMLRVTRGVDTDLFTPHGPHALENLRHPAALYVGRVAIEKNIGAFLDMEWPGDKIIVGDGPSLADLRRKHPNAIFAGRQEGAALAAHYRSADLFVFPSRTDTFGLVIAEALACGLPVAAYNVTGPKDIITTPPFGALHDSDLAAAATRALAVQEKDLSTHRHFYVKENYSWRTAAQQFLEMQRRAEAG